MLFTLVRQPGRVEAYAVSRVRSAAAAHIGEQLERFRLEASMTQDELAVRAGIDSSNVRAYLGGRGLPNLSTLVRLAEALGVPPGALIDEVTPDMFPTAAIDRRRRVS